MVGKLAVSLAGHDKGSVFLIVREEAGSVYVADGVLRHYASPKKKNIKHIQPVLQAGMGSEELAAFAEIPADADTKIKRYIRLYMEKINSRR